MWSLHKQQRMPLGQDNVETDPLYTMQNCVDSTRIRSFLALSRLATDDIVKTRLNEISKSKCDSYFEQVILPLWRKREKLIKYCGSHAEKLRSEVQLPEEELKKIEYDLRMDPYALRDHKELMQLKYRKIEAIENWVHNESTIESIIKDQTASLFNQKCYYKDWLKAFFDSN